MQLAVSLDRAAVPIESRLPVSLYALKGLSVGGGLSDAAKVWLSAVPALQHVENLLRSCLQVAADVELRTFIPSAQVREQLIMHECARQDDCFWGTGTLTLATCLSLLRQTI